MRDFEFDSVLNAYFNATGGAGSIVTRADEDTKRQITVTNSFERPLFEEIFKDIPIGKKKDLGDLALKKFKLYPDGREIFLPLLYLTPTEDKPNRSELRLYMNKGAFRPKADDFWFAFIRQNEMWLGVMSPDELERARTGAQIDLQDGLDAENEIEFQQSANSKSPVQYSSSTLKYARDPNQAFAALNAARHTCEVYPELKTFTSRRSGKPYVEAHHLIPMFYQKYLTETNIDTSENICSLSPFAHRMLHLGLPADIEKPLKLLCDKRQTFLKKVGLQTNDLLKIYGAL
jgi:5-methylcytosine-specific restriction enzyme A